ncbi:MAG: VIT1/CCC1 transporter family protein [Dehalococcoidia bacterium]
MESSAAPDPQISPVQEDYLRSLMFGLQDGLVSTTGVVVGISAGVSDKDVIILAAFVAVLVEATSMAAGQYSSEKSVHQIDRSGRHTDSLLIGAGIMFVAYLVGGMFPIVPTILLGRPEAQVVAVLAAFAGLFTVGFVKGKVVEQPPLRSAVELFVIGAVATSIGLAVGFFLKV